MDELHIASFFLWPWSKAFGVLQSSCAYKRLFSENIQHPQATGKLEALCFPPDKQTQTQERWVTHWAAFYKVLVIIPVDKKNCQSVKPQIGFGYSSVAWDIPLFLSSILGELYLVDMSFPITICRVFSVVNIKTLSDILGIRTSFHWHNHIHRYASKMMSLSYILCRHNLQFTNFSALTIER